MVYPVVLINVFEVPGGAEDDFVAWWKESSAVLQKEPGFIEAKLHQSLKSGARFQFINVAYWETPEALDLARNKHTGVLSSLATGKGNPALYQVIAQYSPSYM